MFCVIFVDSWYPDELNDGKVENLFFLMAGLMAVNFFVFIFVAKCYKYRRETEEIRYDVIRQSDDDTEDSSILSSSHPYNTYDATSDNTTSKM